MGAMHRFQHKSHRRQPFGTVFLQLAQMAAKAFENGENPAQSGPIRLTNLNVLPERGLAAFAFRGFL
jgi:hypothetical protein